MGRKKIIPHVDAGWLEERSWRRSTHNLHVRRDTAPEPSVRLHKRWQSRDRPRAGGGVCVPRALGFHVFPENTLDSTRLLPAYLPERQPYRRRGHCGVKRGGLPRACPQELPGLPLRPGPWDADAEVCRRPPGGPGVCVQPPLPSPLHPRTCPHHRLSPPASGLPRACSHLLRILGKTSTTNIFYVLILGFPPEDRLKYLGHGGQSSTGEMRS